MAEIISKVPDLDHSSLEAIQSTAKSHSSATAEDIAGRRVVVVIGSGRSGTSLCAKILSEMGVHMQASLSRPNEMNPEGYFEDRDIVEINKRLLDKLSPTPELPPRNRGLQLIRQELKNLRVYLKQQTENAPGVWGFKDPRVSLLLPYYRRAFQSLGIVPTYIFCARSGSAIVQSLTDVSDTTQDLAEMKYFTRSFLALRDCGANCYVLHYEKLLSDPWEQARQLWNYVAGEDTTFPFSRATAEKLVNPALNRSELRASPLRNPLASRLEALIERMEGTTFDRQHVLAELADINDIYKSYDAWLDKLGEELEQAQLSSRSAVEHSSAQDSMQKEIATLKSELARLQKTEAELKLGTSKLRDENLEQRQKSIQLEKEIEDGRAEYNSLQEISTDREQKIIELQRQISALQLQQTELTNSADSIIRELSDLRADNRRLEEERNAAVTHARSRLGDVVEIKRELKKSEADAKRRASVAIRNTDEAKEKLAATEKKLSHYHAEIRRLAAALEEKVQENKTLTASVRFRAGKLLVEAISRPGLNTVALPWRLLKLRK